MVPDFANIQIALDKNGKKIGKVDDQSSKEQINVINKSLLRKTIKVIFKQTDVLKQEGNKVWLDITKSEFGLTIKKHHAMRKQTVKKAKMAEASSSTKAISIVFNWGKL
ncbi:MAG: hypothetical protein FK730_09885 [Asgard group archaeon]|nr:hypothetical protein [Asgard group archaeon]